MTPWRLRPARSDDVGWIAELRAVVMRADLERLGRFDEQYVRQRFRDGFHPEHTQVIDVDGGPVGCVALRPAVDARWLEHFYLAPAVQRSGVGGAVLAHLLEDTDARSVTVRLNVLQGSRARRLCERFGFVVESADEVDVFMVREPGPPVRAARRG